MSEKITHTAILDDTFRLVEASDEISEAFQDIVREKRDLARLAAATRWGDHFTVSLLDRLRSSWDDRSPEDALETRLAFVLGWLSHRAADRQMKPVFREFDPQKSQFPTECSIYHDAFLYMEVYGGVAERLYNDAVVGVSTPQPPEQWQILRELFHTLLQQSLLELHTFIPDADDIWGWIGRLDDLRQRYEVDVNRYAKAIADPDPEKMQRYVIDAGFYSKDDAIIDAARRLQLGEQVGADQIRSAVKASASSHYGQALLKSYMYTAAASAFFAGRLDEHQLHERLDIFKPGRDGKPV